MTRWGMHDGAMRKEMTTWGMHDPDGHVIFFPANECDA